MDKHRRVWVQANSSRLVCFPVAKQEHHAPSNIVNSAPLVQAPMVRLLKFPVRRHYESKDDENVDDELWLASAEAANLPSFTRDDLSQSSASPPADFRCDLQGGVLDEPNELEPKATRSVSPWRLIGGGFLSYSVVGLLSSSTRTSLWFYYFGKIS